MGDFTTGISLLTDLVEADVRAMFGLSSDGPTEYEYAPGKRFKPRFHDSMVGQSHFGRQPDMTGYFADGARGDNKSRRELQGEVESVLRWFNLKDRVTAGLYHIGGITYFYWDNDTESVVVNSHIRSWENPESRLLRRIMHERGQHFEAKKIAESTYPWQGGIGVRRATGHGGHPLELLWSSPHRGALELASRACELGYRLDLGRTFSFPEASGAVEVDLPGVECLLNEFARALDDPVANLGAAAYWTDTIVGLLALLIVDGRPTPAPLTNTLPADWFRMAHDLAKVVAPDH